MPPPLTPAQGEALQREYTATGVKAEAARRVGVGESTARRYLSRSDRCRLHARACEKGERAGRRALLAQLERIDGMLQACTDPKAVESLTRALETCVRRVESLRNSHETRTTQRLQRDALRKQIHPEDGQPAGVPLPPSLASPRTEAPPGDDGG